MDQAQALAAARRPQTLGGAHATPFPYRRRTLLNASALALGDGLALSLALAGAGLVRLLLFGEPYLTYWSWAIIPVWWCGAGMTRLLPGWGLGPVEELRRVTLLLLLTYAAMASALFVSQDAEQVSRLNLTIALALSLPLVPLVRTRVRWLLVRFGRWGVPTVVYGAGRTGSRVVTFLHDELGLGLRPIGLFDDQTARWGMHVRGTPILGGTHLVSRQAPVAILAMPGISRERSIELLEGALSRYRTVLVIPDLLEGPSLWVHPRAFNGMLGLEITCNLENPFARFFKRAVDTSLVMLTAPYWLPVCALIAWMIWLEDHHTPFFRQERAGQGGKVFEAWKFRTMVPDAEAVLRRELACDASLRHEWETSFKLRRDPRITRLGAFLRRYSLDELPQLLNVLRGEMSLVGPRPLPLYHCEALPARVRRMRERVRPGMTGLWQVSGRSDAGTEGMEQWDPYYVRHWSLWLDIVVLIRTVRVVAQGSGAY